MIDVTRVRSFIAEQSWSVRVHTHELDVSDISKESVWIQQPVDQILNLHALTNYKL